MQDKNFSKSAPEGNRFVWVKEHVDTVLLRNLWHHNMVPIMRYRKWAQHLSAIFITAKEPKRFLCLVRHKGRVDKYVFIFFVQGQQILHDMARIGTYTAQMVEAL